MNKFKIGFIGGCINNQIGVNRQDLFHAVASNLMSQINLNHQISLGTYLSFDQLFDQTNKFIHKKKPHLIYLFIRPFPLMPLQKPIVKFDRENESIGYSLHPEFFTRQLKWNEKLTKNQSSSDYEFVRKSVFGFRDINLLAGVILGLHSWALKYLSLQLTLIQQICIEQKITLKIISPPKNPESVLANLICKWTTNFLKKKCQSNQLGFININSFSFEYFEHDKIHFNIHGHKVLGKLIFKDMISDKQLADKSSISFDA
jgi:hypothetical protein